MGWNPGFYTRISVENASDVSTFCSVLYLLKYKMQILEIKL